MAKKKVHGWSYQKSELRRQFGHFEFIMFTVHVTEVMIHLKPFCKKSKYCLSLTNIVNFYFEYNVYNLDDFMR